jgi:hypothetical protein
VVFGLATDDNNVWYSVCAQFDGRVVVDVVFLRTTNLKRINYIKAMTQLELYEDQTRLGTFSQIRLSNGDRILISLTRTELSFAKVILGIPVKRIMKGADVFALMDLIYPYDYKSSNANESLLKIVTEIALNSDTSIKEFTQMFWKNVEIYSNKIKEEGPQ